jgi:hypothetical protein
MINKQILASYKILFGILGISAIITEIVALVSRGIFSPGNFFSFFTIESNVFAAIILIISGIMVLAGKSSRLLTVLRGAATLYMVTTGIVFALLLSGLEAGVLTAVPWDNTVLHYIIPLAVLVDWIVDPPRKKIAFKTASVWLAFPIIYVVYSMIRGSVVNWYPYPFLNPTTSGYLGVLVTSIGIAVTVLVLTWILIRIKIPIFTAKVP